MVKHDHTRDLRAKRERRGRAACEREYVLLIRRMNNLLDEEARGMCVSRTIRAVDRMLFLFESLIGDKRAKEIANRELKRLGY